MAANVGEDHPPPPETVGCDVSVSRTLIGLTSLPRCPGQQVDSPGKQLGLRASREAADQLADIEARTEIAEMERRLAASARGSAGAPLKGGKVAAPAVVAAASEWTDDMEAIEQLHRCARCPIYVQRADAAAAATVAAAALAPALAPAPGSVAFFAGLPRNPAHLRFGRFGCGLVLRRVCVWGGRDQPRRVWSRAEVAPALRTLRLVGCHVTELDPGLTALASVTNLDCSSNQVRLTAFAPGSEGGFPQQEKRQK